MLNASYVLGRRHQPCPVLLVKTDSSVLTAFYSHSNSNNLSLPGLYNKVYSILLDKHNLILKFKVLAYIYRLCRFEQP